MAHSERHVRLFRNGRNQARSIPREFELDGDEAILRKGHLLALLETLKPLEEPFPDVDEDLPPLDLAVVTANTREFTRVPGLKVENWLSD
jgi:antitoxin VapB